MICILLYLLFIILRQYTEHVEEHDKVIPTETQEIEKEVESNEISLEETRSDNDQKEETQQTTKVEEESSIQEDTKCSEVENDINQDEQIKEEDDLKCAEKEEVDKEEVVDESISHNDIPTQENEENEDVYEILVFFLILVLLLKRNQMLEKS